MIILQIVVLLFFGGDVELLHELVLLRPIAQFVSEGGLAVLGRQHTFLYLGGDNRVGELGVGGVAVHAVVLQLEEEEVLVDFEVEVKAVS